MRDLPVFHSVEEFPSIERNLLHFPLRGQGDAAQAGAQSEREPLSPVSLLIQHLASPLHFVNTHFNGYGRPPRGVEAVLPVAGEAGAREAEEKEAAGTQGPQQSLEALSEEIVTTAISTVVQNTLSALLRSSESSESSEDPSLAEFLPTEIPPGAVETSTPPTDTTANTTQGADEDPDEAIATESGTGEEVPDDTLAPAEEEDFEILDQSELEQFDGGLDLVSDRQAVGGASGAPETPPSPQHQPQS